jgi:putative aldouronate transport system permease protein
MIHVKRQREAEAEGTEAKSAFSGRINLVVSLLFLLLTVLVFLPVLLVLIVSISSEQSVTQNGYTFFPSAFSLESWRYVLRSGGYLVQSVGNSLLITAAGTVAGLILMCPIAYALSRKHYRYRGAILIFLMIPMLFSGGLVSTYMVNTQILHLQNTYFALILPGLCSTWFIMILRNYYQTAVPASLIEAAMMDGGRQLQIFLKIVVPITTPVMMTIALFQIFAYWNSWYPALLYLDSNHPELYPLQYVLVNMQRSIDMLAKDSQFISGALSYTPPAVTVRMVLVVLAILPILLIFPFFQSFVRNGLTVGAVKE